MPFAAANRVIMDAMHGLTEVDPRFWRVVDAPEVQRLRWIRQTGLAYLVYPGAEHSRFAHAIGAYSVSRRVFNHLRHEISYRGTLSPSQLDGDLELAFTTAALCHDLGHTAFSHVLETLLLPKDFRSHEDCTLELLREGQVGKEVKNLCDFEQVVQLLAGTHWNDGLCKLLSGNIDVDRWDYVMRDAAAAGLVYGNYDLDWLIRSLSLHPDSGRRPRLLVEAHRGLFALEHFLSARRSMYQQVYYHTTVRGAERLLRAIFERACDPARPERYKKDTTAGVPQCLHRMLRGKRPTLDDLIDTDDTVIVAALKRWSRFSADPVLQYLATCLIERRLFKEVRFENTDVDAVRKTTRSAVARALARRTSSDLPVINRRKDEQALDYFVLVDTCTFKTHGSFDGIMFDCGAANPTTFEDLQSKREYAIATRQPITRTRMFVPPEVLGSVKSALRKLESK
jgi:HD superfamily phosphohydrolase